MKSQNFKYIIHLKAGDVVNINGIPCELYGEADLGTNTDPREGLIGVRIGVLTNEESD